MLQSPCHVNLLRQLGAIPGHVTGSVWTFNPLGGDERIDRLAACEDCFAAVADQVRRRSYSRFPAASSRSAS